MSTFCAKNNTSNYTSKLYIHTKTCKNNSIFYTRYNKCKNTGTLQTSIIEYPKNNNFYQAV